MTRQFIGASRALSDIEAEIDAVAPCDAKVLITGESGVGKEIVAGLLHERSGRTGPLLSFNCAGVPDSLLESELFGYVRGSFTGAYHDKRGWLDRAQNGTIFLDEVGETSLRMQALLLRFLESGEIQRVGSNCVEIVTNVRVIAATNRNLGERIATKEFREDLYYRLNVIHILVPPLRDRRDDIVPLTHHFLETFSVAHRVPRPALSDDALDMLIAYPWPGNVRELGNVIERLVLRRCGALVSDTDLAAVMPTGVQTPISPPMLELVRRSTADALYERMVRKGESFWTAVHTPFTCHDLTRGELRALVAQGLEHTKGNYRGLASLFNLSVRDYKRFLNFLKKYDCHLPFHGFRSIREPAPLGERASSASVNT
jgi:transcriptional regulator with GAF, ATPase, and Fis domain